MSKTKWYQKPIYLLVALALVLSLGIMAVPMAGTVEASPADWYVDDSADPGGDGTTPALTGPNCAFQTIGAGITVASAGDTISVAAGTYNEQVIINKTDLTVQSTDGASVTFIDGTGLTPLSPEYPNLVWLQEDGITFSGFTVQNYPDTWGAGAVIYIQHWPRGEKISGCLVTENIVTASPDGTHTIIIGWDGGGGADENTISNNIISGSGWNGIDINCGGPSSLGNIISGNTITGSRDYGIILATDTWGTSEDLSGSIISGNEVSGGTHGIGIAYGFGTEASPIIIKDNYIHEVTTGEAEGIEIYHGAYVNISHNRLEGNGKGIQVKGADCTDIVANWNNITGNSEYGVEVVDVSETVDATNNWWGDASGPEHILIVLGSTDCIPPSEGGWNCDVCDMNPDGLGDKVSDNVDYCPWLILPYGQVATATGSGTASFSSSDGIIEDLAAVDEATLPPDEGKPALEFPHGFFSFNIVGLTPGQTVVVTITLPDDVPEGTQYWKCHDTTWIDVTSLLGDNDGDNVLTLTLTDGGLGDDDEAANGVIVDDGGPGNPPPPVGGTVYPVNKLAILAPWIALGMAIIAATTVILRRRRAQG